MAWDQAFTDPIILPGGRKLLAEHDAREWQAGPPHQYSIAAPTARAIFDR
jgi:hypothetical protein